MTEVLQFLAQNYDLFAQIFKYGFKSIHPAFASGPSCVPEKVSVNQKWYSHQK
jgi:hypothetical protein